jgi:predicted transcriptional regulator
MDDGGTFREVVPHLVSKIVASYVKHHSVGPGELTSLITLVRRSLNSVGKTIAPPESREPAVPVKRSVQHDYVVCLECGFRGQAIRRHIHERHGLDPAGYRARWKLRDDHPIVAPAYSQRRSTLAKQIGLGRKPVLPDVSAEAPPSGGMVSAGLDPAFVASLSARKALRRGRKARSVPTA